MPNHYAENQIDQNKKQWIESAYKFTQPVRYFKNNDPYHWEIDNIPIKQLEENVLWLKDQVEAGSQVSGITRSDLAELKPVATGSSRTVRVQKGRFTARINDAYGKGIQTLIKTANATVDPNAPSDRKFKFNLPTNILKQIAGDVVGEALYFNGLYEHLQHHQVNPSQGNLSWTAAALTTIASTPKNKLAVWRQGQTMSNQVEGLAEQAVAFTRRWGGAIRTSIVNVKDDIEIQVPAFSDTDYSNNTGYSPAMRADLLFVYAHPIDADSTTIALPDGEGPTTITEPRLGLLKGAGVVSLKGFGEYTGYDSTDANDAGFFDSTLFTANQENSNAFFRETDAVSEEGHFQTVSPLADLTVEQGAFADVSVSFPSPDDVMNLTPLFQEGLENSFALVGQSILPIAYVIVRKGKTVIEDSDIIDIRPFFRTAELSYNERAGVAAANPPLSFANPAVGKTELNSTMVKAVTQLKTYVDSAVGGIDTGTGGSTGGGGSRFITKGAILGGTKFGVEGALLSLAGANDDSTIGNEQEAISYLQNKHGLIGLPELPRLPGWDLGGWTANLNDTTDLGSLRNDRINCAIKLNNGSFQDFTGSEITQSVAESLYDRIDNNNFRPISDGVDEFLGGTEIIYYLRKRLKVTLPLNVIDYDVNAVLRNCVPSSGSGGTRNRYSGIAIEKHGIVGNEAEFTIYVAFTPNAATEFFSTFPGTVGVHRDQVLNDSSFGQRAFWAPMNSKSTVAQRGRDVFSAFSVFTEYYTQEFRNVSTGSNFKANNSSDAVNLNFYQPSWSALVPLLVTYPTVEFTVTGHTQVMGQNYIFDTQTTGGQPIIT